MPRKPTRLLRFPSYYFCNTSCASIPESSHRQYCHRSITENGDKINSTTQSLQFSPSNQHNVTGRDNYNNHANRIKEDIAQSNPKNNASGGSCSDSKIKPEKLRRQRVAPTICSDCNCTSSTFGVIKEKLSTLPSMEFRQHPNETIMQRSLPIFEVLPPLMPDATNNLFYQNFYLLDGLRCEYEFHDNPPNYTNQKLSVDYAKFLKSINKNSKPTDFDIIFGTAKVLFTKNCGWERSRIEWLLRLERRQEQFKRSAKRQPKTSGNLASDETTELNICWTPFNDFAQKVLDWH